MVSTVILAMTEDCPDAFYTLDVVEEVVRKVQASVGVDQPATARPARETRELMKGLSRFERDETVKAVFRW
jgi:hypothetical protein